jgi:23S rRNA pseudouridine1911/1915/1917 synthase
LIRVNGRVATTATLIQGGEHIEFSPAPIQLPERKFDLKLKVLFEDDYLAIIDKPAGVLVSGNSFMTITNALPQNLTSSTQADAVLPKPVHRLDFATTGILLVGKTADSIRRLTRLFENKEIHKCYYAVTMGSMNPVGIIDQDIEGKEATSHYEQVTSVNSPRFKQLNLVKLLPKTGRRHQLRIHLSGMGNPILGDRDYSPEHLILKGKGMYLHAYSLEFTHPFSGQKVLETAPLPTRFAKIFPKESLPD